MRSYYDAEASVAEILKKRKKTYRPTGLTSIVVVVSLLRPDDRITVKSLLQINRSPSGIHLSIDGRVTEGPGGNINSSIVPKVVKFTKEPIYKFSKEQKWRRELFFQI